MAACLPRRRIFTSLGLLYSRRKEKLPGSDPRLFACCVPLGLFFAAPQFREPGAVGPVTDVRGDRFVEVNALGDRFLASAASEPLSAAVLEGARPFGTCGGFSGILRPATSRQAVWRVHLFLRLFRSPRFHPHPDQQLIPFVEAPPALGPCCRAMISRRPLPMLPAKKAGCGSSRCLLGERPRHRWARSSERIAPRPITVEASWRPATDYLPTATHSAPRRLPTSPDVTNVRLAGRCRARRCWTRGAPAVPFTPSLVRARHPPADALRVLRPRASARGSSGRTTGLARAQPGVPDARPSLEEASRPPDAAGRQRVSRSLPVRQFVRRVERSSSPPGPRLDRDGQSSRFSARTMRSAIAK